MPRAPIDIEATADTGEVLRLSGSPRQRGVQHGRARSAEIRRIAARSAELRQAGRLPDGDGDGAAELADTESWFGPAELEELSGLAEGAGVAVSDLIAHNLRLSGTAGSGGVHFALTGEANRPYDLLHGANEESQYAQWMSGVCRPILFAVHPDEGIAYVTFGLPGQIGGLSGINARGVSLSTAALHDLDDVSPPAAGRLHGVLVKNILEGAGDIDAAIDIFRQDPGRTPYALCLSHFVDDRLCHIEYDLNLLKVLPWTPDVIGANHRLMRTVPGEAPAPSRARTERMRELLGGDVPGDVSPVEAMRILRDRRNGGEAETPAAGSICRGDNRLSLLFHPAGESLWVSTGRAIDDGGDVFCHYRLRELLPDYVSQAPATGEDEASAARQSAGDPAEKDRRPTADSLPLIDAVAELAPGERLIAESHLDPAADVFLVQHRFKERPLMPLVVMLEGLMQAAALLAPAGKRVAGLRDVAVENGLRFPSDDVQTVCIAAELDAETIDCRLTGDVRNRQGKVLLKDKPHLRGVVQLAPVDEASPGEPTVTAQPVTDPKRWIRCFYTENIVIYHGPVFRCLRELAVDGERAWGHIVSLPVSKLGGSRTGAGWMTNPALLDACLYACGSFLWLNHRGTIAVPDGFEQLRFGRLPRPHEKCLVSMADRGLRDRQAFYDFSVFGDDGDLLIDVRGYRNTIVAEEPATASRSGRAEQ